MISKELFVSSINEIEEVMNYHMELNKFYRKYGAEGYIYSPDCTETVLRLLHYVFGDADIEEWIEYFVFELNFGKKYEKGMVKDSNGVEVSLSNAEELYEFLSKGAGLN